MSNIFLSKMNIAKGDDKKIVMPKTDEAPVSATEKLVREDIQRLTQNSEEIKKLKEQVEVEKKKKEGASE